MGSAAWFTVDMTSTHTTTEPEEGTVNTPTTDLLTGWAALPVIREADLAYCRGDVARRNELLLTVDRSMWNGRELLEGGLTMNATYTTTDRHAVIYATQPVDYGQRAVWVDVDAFVTDLADADEVLDRWLDGQRPEDIDPYGGTRWGCTLTEHDAIVSEVRRDTPEWDTAMFAARYNNSRKGPIR